MTLGNQATRGVDDIFATVRDAALSDELVRLALGAQAERINGAQFIGAETIVQLDDADIVGGDSGLLQGFLAGEGRHVVSNQIYRGAVEELGRVGSH